MCPSYAVGPPQQQPSRGAVVESYVDTDSIEVLCPACHAPVGEFCRHKSGVERRIPCPRRIGAAKAAREDQ